MKNLLIAILVFAVCGFALLSAGGNFETRPVAAENDGPGSLENKVGSKPRKTLKPFTSKDELSSFLREMALKQRAERDQSPPAGDVANTAAPASKYSEEKKSSKDDGESVTNTQHAGVDEGGIVKLHGDHLVILRRGRLFTVAIDDDSLRPISAVNAYAPEINPDGTWYDEMLVSANTIAVIGYSYQRGGTEIGLFSIDESGNLKYRSTYHLRSNDYYSSRNYASRLIGGKLIFYTPQYLWINSDDPTSQFPALRKWHKGATDKEFRPIVAATKVYRPARELNSQYGLALHTVTVCDLESEDFKCEGTGVIGPAGRVFYVSPKFVYVWTSDWDRSDGRSKRRSMVYQMPLDGGGPSALGVAGSPVDQFSFLESDDNHLNVLVRSDGGGEAMWGSESTSGDTALLRVPLWSFSDGTGSASYWNYKPIPKPEGYTLQNRFVGNYLLYGTGNGWSYPDGRRSSNLYAVRWATGETSELPIEHSVDRIEALGKDAVVVGTLGSDLYFSPVRLGEDPGVRAGYVRKNAAQGELRSHGFFYRPLDADSGMLGLPIAEEGRPGYRQLFEGSASILFLRNDSLKLSEIGTLASSDAKQRDDNCKASCVDWYGNARPLFIRGRVFALLGYEIVEGRMAEAGIREKRRINFAPGAAKVARAVK